MRFYITPCFFAFLHLSFVPGNSFADPSQAICLPPCRTLWSTDFSLLSSPVREDLSAQGFTFEKDMQSESMIQLSVDRRGLTLTSSEQAFGFMLKRDLHIKDAQWLEIEWGVDAYPPGADWQSGKRYDPLMVVLFFGEPLPGKIPLLPDVPLFIGMFLGKNEPLLHPYASTSYPETGRYVCLDGPPPGLAIRSRIDIAAAFSRWFAGREMAPITGIAVEVDTGEMGPGTSSSAFIKSISLHSAE